MEEAMDYLEDELQLVLFCNKQQSQPFMKSTHGQPTTTARNEPISTGSTAPYIIRTLPQHNNDDGLTDQSSWTVTLQPTDAGIQLQTSITNIGDLLRFLAQRTGGFSNSPQRPPSYYSNVSQQKLVVTNKMLQVEYTLRQVFGKPSSQRQHQHNRQETPTNHVITTTATLPNSYDHTRRAAILHLVDSYFNCVRGMAPIVSSYYHPLISKKPDSTVAYALAGFMALSACVIHVDEKSLPYNRSAFGLHLYETAHEKLADDLFDNDDHGASVEMIIILLTMVQASMILLRNNDTRLYLHLAWEMVLTLRDDCLAILQQQQHVPSTTPELARAETWRRLFYGVRYMVIHVRIIQYDSVDFASLLSQSNIGYPQPLLCEMDDPRRIRMVNVYCFFVRLDDCHISSNANGIAYRLFAGELDQASLSEISHMEHRLFFFWQGLPKAFHLTRTPLEYLDPAVIHSCQDNHILHLNQYYYSQWLTLESRFMQLPSTADLQHTTLTQLDNGRALLIVSICGDALTHIFQVLYHREPCMLDLHWLLITTDALRMLTKTANHHVRYRAGHNLRICLPILMAQMQPKHMNLSSSSSSSSLAKIYPIPSSSSPSFSSNAPCSPSVTSTSSVSSNSSTGNIINLGLQHASSPGNSSTSTTSDGLLEEVDEETWIAPPSPPSTFDSSSKVDPSGAYFGEIKKNLESYFMDKPV
ncbi:unnamed protein product [Absidia cylindrospora]